MVNVVAAYVGVMRKFNGDVLCDSDTLVEATQYFFEAARVLREKGFQPCSVREAITYEENTRFAKGHQTWRDEVGKSNLRKSSALEEDVKHVLSDPKYLIEAMKDAWLLFHTCLGESVNSPSLRPLRRAEKKIWFLLVWANEVYTSSDARVQTLNLDDVVSCAQVNRG